MRRNDAEEYARRLYARIPAHYRVEYRPVRKVEKLVYGKIGVRMRPAHEAITDQRHTQRFHDSKAPLRNRKNY